MKKILSLHFSTIITTTVMFAFVYYFLLLSDHFSIRAMITLSQQHWHLFVLTLLPIYIALVLCSASLMGVYLGGSLKQLLTQGFKKHLKKTT